MANKHYRVVILLLVFIKLSSCQLLSPCPSVFNYECDENGCFGAIRLPSKDIRNVLNLTVSLRFEKTLPSKYLGYIEIYGSRSDVYEIMFNKVQPLTYRLYFPSPFDVFHVEQIAANETIICIGYPPQNAIHNIILTHDFEFEEETKIDNEEVKCNVKDYYTKIMKKNPFNEKKCSNVMPNKSVINRIFQQPPFIDTGRPDPDNYVGATTLPELKPTLYNRNQINSFCGRPVRNITAERENWPWLSGVFRRDISQLTLVSGATLISENTVVTAAQPISRHNNRPIRIQELGVRVGLYDLTAWTDSTSNMRAVYQIIYHPEFNPNTLIMHNNIALLKIQPVELSSFVFPICITNIRAVYYDVSSIVEWDRSDIPSSASEFNLPIINNEQCKEEAIFSNIISEKTICGRSINATIWCQENQGGGLYIKRYNTSYLGGILSYSFKDHEKCGVKPTRLYTDVTRYYTWINENW